MHLGAGHLFLQAAHDRARQHDVANGRKPKDQEFRHADFKDTEPPELLPEEWMKAEFPSFAGEMLLADTHTHLYAGAFDADRPALIEAARKQGVGRFYLPNIDVESIGPMLALEEHWPGLCIPMMGLHPCHVLADYRTVLARIEQELARREWVAIGEIGIDLYWDKTYFKEQQEAFQLQVRWANEKKLPVAIHSRQSFAEIIALLDEQPKLTPQGIFHCFTGTLEEARQAIDRGFYLGIGGVVTFKKSGLDAVVEKVPLEHLVLETDAPYLAPTPHRGKRNLPEYVRLVAEKIAEIKGVSLEEVARVTTENAERIFGWEAKSEQ